MGGGASAQNAQDVLLPTKVFLNGKLIGDDRKGRALHLSGGYLYVHDANGSLVFNIDLDRDINIMDEKIHDEIVVTIREGETVLVIYFLDEDRAQIWKERLTEEITVAKAKLMNDHAQGLDRMISMMGALDDCTDDEESSKMPSQKPQDSSNAVDLLPLPRMTIVIMVVGTRGDVQPFVNLGLALQGQGHTVRVATHAEYRADVTKEGLLYYPLAGIS